MPDSTKDMTKCWQCTACGKWVEPGDGSDCVPLAAGKPPPPTPAEQLRKFAKFVCDYSNDPGVIAEARKYV